MISNFTLDIAALFLFDLFVLYNYKLNVMLMISNLGRQPTVLFLALSLRNPGKAEGGYNIFPKHFSGVRSFCDPCSPSLGSLEDISTAQIYRANLKSVAFFLLSFVVIYSLYETCISLF